MAYPGNAPAFARDPIGFAKRCQSTHGGDIIRLNLFGVEGAACTPPRRRRARTGEETKGLFKTDPWGTKASNGLRARAADERRRFLETSTTHRTAQAEKVPSQASPMMAD